MKKAQRACGLVSAGALVASVVLTGHEEPALAGPTAGASSSKTSTAADRKDISITVYNQNFGLVRETRSVDLGTGKVSLEVGDVAATIQPETVAIRSTTDSGSKSGVSVLEQNYRYDLLSPGTLLEKYVGKKLKVYRYNELLGKEEPFDATLMSVADGRPVLEINGELTFDFGGRFGFPGVPANLISHPTLVWLLDSKAAKQDLEITYLAQSIGWSADYVMVVDDTDTSGDLTGWVTLNNQSGASYTNAKLELVAGDVNRVQPGYYGPAATMDGDTGAAQNQFSEQSLFEYHEYTLDRPTDILQNEQKQVTLLEASKIKVEKKLIFYGEPGWFRGEYGQILTNQKVGVYLDLQNSKDNGLGMPLPKGTVRVYKADKSGSRQFVGEDRIDHTARDEKLRIKMGEAFDVVGDRKQKSYTVIGTCTTESTWEIELRNHKDTAIQVEDYEPVGGDWKVLDSSDPYTKKDASTFTFTVDVPANGKKTVTYTVRVRWC